MSLQPITEEVRLPHPDIVRLARLTAKNWNPNPLTASEVLDLMETQRRVDAYLETLVQEERTEGRTHEHRESFHDA